MKYITTNDATAIIKVKGIFGIGIARTIENEFSIVKEKGCSKIIYDFSNTESLDSVGLATIMTINKQIKERPKLKNPNNEVIRLLTISDMIDEFELV